MKLNNVADFESYSYSYTAIFLSKVYTDKEIFHILI